MATSLVHFGLDDCHRILVLEQAGYKVDDCQSVRSLLSVLIRFPEPDAVAIAENIEIDVDEALSLVRSHSTAPTVLFRCSNANCAESAFNLVVPSLTDPRVWLDDLAELIDRSRMLRSYARLVQQQSALIRESAAQAREKSLKERKRAAELRNRSRIPNPCMQEWPSKSS